MVPVHPKDAGSTILGRPIRSHPWASENPELFVFFLSATSVLQELRKWLIEGRNIPFIWLQPGPESPELEEFLSDSGMDYSVGRCWVVTVNEENLTCAHPLQNKPGVCKRLRPMAVIARLGNTSLRVPTTLLDAPLEWVGDLIDLQESDEMIPRYIRSLVKEGHWRKPPSV